VVRPRVTGSALKRLLDCERRLWRSAHARVEAAERSEHDEVLGERSRALEDAIAATIPDLAGPMLLPGLSFEAAAAESVRLLRETARPIRRPLLVSADGLRTATPAFILRDGEALVIRDVRLAHRPEMRRDNRVRVAFAGWLAREVTGLDVARLEVVNGLGQVIEVEPEPDAELARLAARALELLDHAPEPDILLAHSHCQHCDHYDHCWDRAEAERRIEVMPAVTRARAPLLHAEDVRTFDELAARAPESFRHRELRAHGRRLVEEARAWATGEPVWHEELALPRGRTPVWFDVESDSDGERAEVPVYLWGLAVEGSESRLEPGSEPRFEPILAELTPAGDRNAWERFVARALEVVREHPDAVWVHWHAAEPMWLDRYIARLGAPPKFVAAMRAPGALFDLHRVIERTVRLPLRSTSIKFVARWMGFAWSNPDADAEWSTAQLHRARETADPAERERLLAEVARYNEDDVRAMRVVWRWLERNGR
jgi:predicted RecB family nuclease